MLEFLEKSTQISRQSLLMWYFSMITFFKKWKWKTRPSKAFSFALSVDMWKPYRKQVLGLTDGIQNWFYLHLLSSWLDLANGGCMRWMNNWSLTAKFALGESGGLSQGTQVPFMWMSPFILFSSHKQTLLFCKAKEYWVWGGKKGPEIYFRLLSSGIVLKTSERNMGN